MRAVCAEAPQLLPQIFWGWEWTIWSPYLARAQGQWGSFFSFHAAGEAPEGEGSEAGVQGYQGCHRALLTSSPVCFLIHRVTSVPAPAHKRMKNIFTLWCQHSIGTVTSAAFPGLICANYHVCNHRESDYFLKQVESGSWLS